MADRQRESKSTDRATASEITFRSTAERAFQYQLVVTGRVERGGTYQSEGGDQVVGNIVQGAAAGGRADSYLFTGEITVLQVDGPGKVFVDGELIVDTSGEAPAESLTNELTVAAEGALVEYEFQVSGRVERGSRAEASDRVLDSNAVRGTVQNDGVDNYRYSGAVAIDEPDGPLSVTLDFEP